MSILVAKHRGARASCLGCKIHIVVRIAPVVVLNSGVEPVLEPNEEGQSPDAVLPGVGVIHLVSPARAILACAMQRPWRGSPPGVFLRRDRARRSIERPSIPNHVDHVIRTWQNTRSGAYTAIDAT